MKKLLLSAVILSLVSSTSHAGFLSSVAAGMTANALSSSGGSVSSSDGKTIQEMLRYMGLYEDGPIDGNLNTFDSRIAIKKFQEAQDGGFFGFAQDVEMPGVLSQRDILNILYLSDLVNKTAGFEIKDQESFTKAYNRQDLILREARLIEDGSSINKIGDLIEERMEKYDDVKSRWKDLLWEDGVSYLPRSRLFYYVDQGKTFEDTSKMQEYCAKISVGDLAWQPFTRRNGSDTFYESLELEDGKPGVFIATTDKGLYIAAWKTDKGYLRTSREKEDVVKKTGNGFHIACIARVKDKFLTQ